ncbi:Phage Tail Protein X [Lacrimispora sphenoides]|uniref:tail protein X n=1 Tax=Lacrimispora sphenoides TaxID=29370 RepID=UPI0008AE892B|nr:tail protein X [Lacrimispora sphenoides]SEU24356.1 Phage Tail Protein X [Lacrimispora sphenoides]
MDKTYTTISGQTWDQIAYEVYGNEHYCDKLMDANRDKLQYFVFPDGIVLKLPSIESMVQTSVSSDYPTWRAMLNG